MFIDNIMQSSCTNWWFIMILVTNIYNAIDFSVHYSYSELDYLINPCVIITIMVLHIVWTNEMTLGWDRPGIQHDHKQVCNKVMIRLTHWRVSHSKFSDMLVEHYLYIAEATTVMMHLLLQFKYNIPWNWIYKCIRCLKTFCFLSSSLILFSTVTKYFKFKRPNLFLSTENLLALNVFF